MKKIPLTQLEDAIDIILQNTLASQKTQNLSIMQARSFVLAQDIMVQRAQPPYDNSAMDGYAVRLCDVGKKVKVLDEIFAGDSFYPDELKDGEAMRIMTGAPLPKSTQAIVPIEDVQKGTQIVLPQKIKKNAHMRFCGEELKEGEKLLSMGDELDSAKIALLCAQGISFVRVFSKPSVAVISSGNEVVEPWEKAKSHQIYNSNTMGIIAMLDERGIDAHYIARVEDEPSKMKEFFAKLLDFDLVIASGGVSVGDKDYTKDVLLDLGFDIFLHGVATKPGKHAIFARKQRTHFLGTPGNALSSISTFYLLVLGMLAKLRGSKDLYHNYSLAKLSNRLDLFPKRTTVVFGMLRDGIFTPYKNGDYGSGMVAPASYSNAFIVLEQGLQGLDKDSIVKVVHSMSPTKTNFLTR